MKAVWCLLLVVGLVAGCSQSDPSKSYPALLQVYTNEQAELKRIDDEMHSKLGEVLAMARMAADLNRESPTAVSAEKALEFTKRSRALDQKIRDEYKPKIDSQAARVASAKAAMEAARK